MTYAKLVLKKKKLNPEINRSEYVGRGRRTPSNDSTAEQREWQNKQAKTPLWGAGAPQLDGSTVPVLEPWPGCGCWVPSQDHGSDMKHKPQRWRMNFKQKRHPWYMQEGTVHLAVTWGWQKSPWSPLRTFPKRQSRLTARRTGPSSVIILLEQRGNILKFWCIPSLGNLAPPIQKKGEEKQLGDGHRSCGQRGPGGALEQCLQQETKLTERYSRAFRAEKTSTLAEG